MDLFYTPIHFFCKSEKPFLADNYLPFVIRSVLGKNLRNMCCVSHKTLCPDCLYKKNCAYSVIFESIVESDNNLLHGTNRVSHPFSITQSSEVSRTKSSTDFDFTITLFGNSCKYLPYIYASMYKAGDEGLFKERTKFKINDVLVGDDSILQNDMELKNCSPFVFKIAESEKKSKGEILVELKTPLRFKIEGKYTKDFSSADFFRALWRRAKTLFLMYGDETEFPMLPKTECKIVNPNLKWKDFRHYSARQKDVMNLGGVVGNFKLLGGFTDFELKLLELNKIANAGKNTNFGLGQIDFWERVR